MNTEKIGNLIGKDKLKEAIEELRKLLDSSEHLDELVLNSARLSGLSKNLRRGQISITDAEVSKNQIRFALLELIREIDVTIQQFPALDPEKKKDDSSTKSVTLNHYGTGDNFVGNKIVNNGGKE